MVYWSSCVLCVFSAANVHVYYAADCRLSTAVVCLPLPRPVEDTQEQSSLQVLINHPQEKYNVISLSEYILLLQGVVDFPYSVRVRQSNIFPRCRMLIIRRRRISLSRSTDWGAKDIGKYNCSFVGAGSQQRRLGKCMGQLTLRNEKVKISLLINK